MDKHLTFIHSSSSSSYQKNNPNLIETHRKNSVQQVQQSRLIYRAFLNEKSSSHAFKKLDRNPTIKH